jgi:hypothetical protein
VKDGTAEGDRLTEDELETDTDIVGLLEVVID